MLLMGLPVLTAFASPNSRADLVSEKLGGFMGSLVWRALHSLPVPYHLIPQTQRVWRLGVVAWGVSPRVWGVACFVGVVAMGLGIYSGRGNTTGFVDGPLLPPGVHSG